MAQREITLLEALSGDILDSNHKLFWGGEEN